MTNITWWVAFKAPAALPVSMCVLNVTSLAVGLMGEGRVRTGALKFSFAYAATVPAALKGDLNPFFAVFQQPAT